MIATIVLALAVLLAAVVEILIPGQSLYHVGWYNVLLAALTIVAVFAARAPARAARTARGRIGVGAIALGAAIAGMSVVASGLLAPDNRVVVGAPGASVRVAAFGTTLQFPSLAPAGAAEPTVALRRANGSDRAIGARPSDLGRFVARSIARSVVVVTARDANGAHLTVTQPTGGSFLSPVLLMQAHQTIAGLDLPFDAFAVPALHRSVKAVLFSPAQAALLRGMAAGNRGAVLFAVDDDAGRPLAHGIALVPSGLERQIAGVRLRGTIVTYPAVLLMAAPSLIALIVAALCVLAGVTSALAGGPSRVAEGSARALDKAPPA